MLYRYIETQAFPYGTDPQFQVFVNPDQPVPALFNPFLYISAMVRIQDYDQLQPSFLVERAQLLSIVNSRHLTVQNAIESVTSPSFFTPRTESIYPIHYPSFFQLQENEYQIFVDSIAPYVSPNPDIVQTGLPRDETPLSALPDLVVARPKTRTDLRRIHTHGLVTVNGLLHLTSPSDETEHAVYIRDGGTTSRVSGFRHVSVLDFDAVGPIQRIPLDLLTLTPSPTFATSVLVGGLDELLENPADSTLLFSIGGYLVEQSNSIVRNIDGTVTLQTVNMGLPRKIVDAARFLDLTSVGLDAVDYDPTNEAVIEAFLRLPQSFLISIPRRRMKATSVSFQTKGDNRSVYLRYRPRGVVRTRVGRLVDYWCEKNEAVTNTLDELHREEQEPFQLHFYTDSAKAKETALYKELVQRHPRYAVDGLTIVSKIASLGFHD